MSYPKTKKEAVKRLIEKIEKAMRNDQYECFGNITSCPLCQFIAYKNRPNQDDVDCRVCFKLFGEMLGYKHRFPFPCTSITFGGMSFKKLFVNDPPKNIEKLRARQNSFMIALLPILKNYIRWAWLPWR